MQARLTSPQPSRPPRSFRVFPRSARAPDFGNASPAIQKQRPHNSRARAKASAISGGFTYRRPSTSAINEAVDAQGDIYSIDEVRQAAHRFLEDFGGLGLMHRLRVNGQVKIVENYLAPTDLVIGDLEIRKGTWLMAVRILADELWRQVKNGDLTGFSIGGSARRVPEPTRRQSE